MSRPVDEILVELLEAMGNPLTESLDRKFEIAVFDGLKGTEGLGEYFRLTMGEDIKRYFSAGTDKERDQIKGAFLRTASFRTKLVQAEKAPIVKERLSGGRKSTT